MIFSINFELCVFLYLKGMQFNVVPSNLLVLVVQIHMVYLFDYQIPVFCVVGLMSNSYLCSVIFSRNLTVNDFIE